MARIPTRTVDVTDDFFGTPVADPYRWLENTDDPEVTAWLAAQAAQTRAYLDGLPGRDAIAAALREVIGLPHSGLPVHRGAHWFRTANDGVQQQDVLLVSDDPFGDARVLIDPNPLTPDASTGIASFEPSPDGSLVAYSYLEAGSDWRTWRVRDVETGADLPDEVRWSKFTEPAWLPDSSGFVYGRFDAPSAAEFVSANAAQWLAVHRVGTAQDDDEHVFALPDEPDMTFWAEVTEDDRWLVITGTRGTDPLARVWVRDLQSDKEIVALITDETAAWTLLGTDGERFVFLTDLDAPRSRVISLGLNGAEPVELVAESRDSLESAVIAGDRLVLHYLSDAASRLTVHELDGTHIRDIAPPSAGSITGLSARADETLFHAGWTSFTTPPGVLALDVTSRPDAADGVFRGGRGPRGFSVSTGTRARLAVEMWFVASKDGTRIPVFLLHGKDVRPENGQHPTWLYGYGGFRIPVTPSFEPTRYAFAAAGGVSVIACLRGGGEYGAQWHDAGRRASKQNVFDDAIAVAEWLIDRGWTTPEQLAVSGRSNGGLLAGALLTQRPDLFAAVVPEVGVLDMLRFPLWTIGWAWTSDYGDPRASEEEFAVLQRYSPLHNLRADAAYPPTMVLTSDHDDRVVPAHSLKFVAQLQAVTADDAVALLRVTDAGGHGAGRSRDALVAERADVLAFVSRHTGLDWT